MQPVKTIKPKGGMATQITEMFFSITNAIGTRKAEVKRSNRANYERFLNNAYFMKGEVNESERERLLNKYDNDVLFRTNQDYFINGMIEKSKHYASLEQLKMI